MLFRDGYRVFPYGDDDDDWLALDRRALASSGYKLNKQQFVGRVQISRIRNSRLIDQTNREGLKDCDEKSVLLEVMQFVIQSRLRQFLDEVIRKHRSFELDYETSERQVRTLRGRALTSIQALEKRHSEELPVLHQLTSIIEEMNDYFLKAKEKAEQVEDERDRMVQLAGIGLMLEIVAHELARSTEHTIQVLNNAKPELVSQELSALFKSLRDEMITMNKRLRVLDPLSVSGRQRRETFDLCELVQEVIAGRAAQFKRHNVRVSLKTSPASSKVMVTGVRGMFIQILENLIQNSIYWMALKRQDESDYKPSITILLGPIPMLMQFSDNGPGIQASLQDEVFKAFFSTKGKSRRQGLGLYIARDCAEHNGASLYLSPDSSVSSGRLNTFILEMQESK
jgi:signal transduction histidine kinase